MKQLLTILFFLFMSGMAFSQSVPVTDTLVLNGTSSTDVDGTIVKYLWKQVSGTPTVINDADKPTAYVILTTAGNYVYSLSVTDNSNATVTVNTPSITVQAADNVLPKAVIIVIPSTTIKLPQKK